MKNIMSKIHTPAKRVLTIGFSVIILLLCFSAFLYVGAGRFFDYYSVIGISEGMLNSVRPLSVFVCLGSVGAEYVYQKYTTE